MGLKQSKMVELYQEHLTNAPGLKHHRFEHLESWNYHPTYQEHKVVPSESKDHAYLVSKIEVLKHPMENADIVEDTIMSYLCSCPAFYYQESSEIETFERKPDEMGKCKHIRSAYREERAKNDNQQETL